jgi:sterol desaturase/sphingolipid hydroxylase (fatty acid hydroxylase superfamily)
MGTGGDEKPAPLPADFAERSRAADYKPVFTKVHDKLMPVASSASLFVALSFFGTPAGACCIMYAMNFCTGFATAEDVRAAPLHHALLAAALTSVWSVGTFAAFALVHDARYADHPPGRCQPFKTHAPSGTGFNFAKRREVREAVAALITAAATSAFVVVGQIKFGAGRIYTDVADHGWAWFLLSFVLYFLWIDLWAYLGHRALHMRPLYRRFHKLHHAYKFPTAFTALAVHPVDMAILQGGIYVGLYVMPLHIGVIGLLLLYIHYFNVVDHSGVYAETWLPWQPSTLYHDDHHQYFHINFGQSLTLWDRMFGTFYPHYERKGKGHTLTENTNPDWAKEQQQQAMVKKAS